MQQDDLMGHFKQSNKDFDSKENSGILGSGRGGQEASRRSSIYFIGK